MASGTPDQPIAPEPAPGAAPASSLGWLRRVWQPVAEFAGLEPGTTYLWPRWLVLRAVGIVYLFVFAGIIREAQALVGPTGIAPIGDFLTQLRATVSSDAEAYWRVPSLFWVSHGSGAITVLSWAGLMAAVALVLNLWPRMALFACWGIFVSFTSTWRVFSPAQLDGLMLETALLLIPFAPAGFRPGLGRDSPPRPLAIFMARWMLFRVMFEAGLVKLTAGDPHWRNFTAMDVMYQTCPLPTVLSYWDHHLPFLWHLGEIALTFFAELAGPLLAVWGGRRGRWIALAAWTVFQAGIQLTSNFGWLNTAAIGMGLLLLDDQMLATAASRLGRWWPAGGRGGRLAPSTAVGTVNRRMGALAAWGWRGVAAGLWLHFGLTLFYFAKVCGVRVYEDVPPVAAVAQFFSNFRSVNAYTLYAKFEEARYHVEFAGSNDGGATWRTYRYRFLPQREDEMGGFVAPWFGRFEATVQIEAWVGRKSPVLAVVAARLLAREPEVMALFRGDPFPDRPPALVRMRGYRMFYTDVATWRRTGRYWRKEFAGEYLPMLYRDEDGTIGQFSLAEGEAALARRDYETARTIFERQYAQGFPDAGLRLAELYIRGLGSRPDPARAVALLSELARRGEIGAEHNLGVCYEFGIGVPADYPQAAALYRRAADEGDLLSLLSLGEMHAMDRITPRDDVAGLSCLLRAMARAKILPDNDPAARLVREKQPALAQRLKERMSAVEITAAEQRAQP